MIEHIRFLILRAIADILGIIGDKIDDWYGTIDAMADLYDAHHQAELRGAAKERGSD